MERMEEVDTSPQIFVNTECKYMPDILKVNHLTKKFGQLRAVDDLSFEVREGEILGMMGPNGAGKTTVFNLLTGVFKPDEGDILFKARDITHESPANRCRQGLGRTYQIPRPFANLTASENIMVAAIYGRELKKSAAEAESAKVFNFVNLTKQKDTLAGNLATLNLKKLELARALASDPALILLDEVAAGSTDVEIPRMLAIIKEIRKMGKTILLIEHVMRVMVEAVDRIIVIDKGVKIAEGTPDQIMEDKKVIGAYFG